MKPRPHSRRWKRRQPWAVRSERSVVAVEEQRGQRIGHLLGEVILYVRPAPPDKMAQRLTKPRVGRILNDHRELWIADQAQTFFRAPLKVQARSDQDHVATIVLALEVGAQAEVVVFRAEGQARRRDVADAGGDQIEVAVAAHGEVAGIP